MTPEDFKEVKAKIKANSKMKKANDDSKTGWGITLDES